MRGLIYKDLYLIKNKIMIMAASLMFTYILMVVVLIVAAKNLTVEVLEPMEGIFDFMVVIYIGLMGFNYLIKVDDSRSWGFYGISLPEGGKSIVASRYMVTFILYFISLTICVINDIICSLVAGQMINVSELYLGVIFFGIFLNALELPLAFRFGADKASVIRILISIVLILIISIYLLFGNIEWLMGDKGILTITVRIIRQMADTPEGSGEGFKVLSDELKSFVKNMTLKGYIAASMSYHLVTLFYYISYRISCKVYRKGVLRDDI